VSRAAVRRTSREFADHVTGPPDALAAEHAAYLKAFQPTRVPREHRESVRTATVAIMARAGHIKGRASFIKRVSDCAALACWAAQADRPLDWQTLMDHSTIHDFARAQAHTTTAANLAHRVRRLEILASTVNPGPNALPRVRKTPHAPVSPPYTPTQMRALEQACRAQSAPSATRGLQAIIGFARGAGASSGELLALGRHDVQDLGPDGIHVTLGAGDTRRTVPVRRAYEPWVRAAINALGPNDPVLPTRGKNAVGHILDQVEILSDGVPRIEVARLRTTWIAELMTLPIPLNVLLSAAGLKSARTVSDIYAHLQTPTYAPNDLLRGEAP
jgi:integrase